MLAHSHHQTKRPVPRQDPFENLAAALAVLIGQLQVQVTQSTIREAVFSHPSAPSMAAAVEALHDWGIETRAVKCAIEQLEQLEFPNMTMLWKHGGYFVMLEAAKNGMVVLTDPEAGRITLSYDEFEKQWSGFVLMAKPGANAGEKDYREKRRQERRQRMQKWILPWGAATLLAMALAFTAFKSPAPLSALALLGVKLAGLFLTGLLASQSLSPNATLLNRLCPKGGASDCGAVLNSAAAKLFGWLPLADAGLLYFSGGIFSLILAGLGGEVVTMSRLLGLLTLPTLPFTLFSVYYQATVIKKWCRLCLGVQLLFWVEFLLIQSHLSEGFRALNGQAIFTIVLGFGIPAFFWMALRPLPEWRRQAADWRYRYLRLRRNPKLLNHLLQAQDSVVLPEALQNIAIGAPDAPFRLTLVTQPSCAYCAEAHRELEQLLERFPNRLSAHIFFWVGEENTLDRKLARYATALMMADEQAQALAVLAEWFTNPARVQIARIDSHAAENRELFQQADEALRQIDQWAAANDIDSTPARFLNGKLIPPDIQLADLMYLLK